MGGMFIMEYIEKHSEYLVLLKLLRKNIEAYLAIKSNQDNYDTRRRHGSQGKENKQDKEIYDK